MIKTLKTTTGKITLSIPEHLSEITLSQLIALQATNKLSDLRAISILSGTSIEKLEKVADANELQSFGKQVTNIAHQLKYLYNSDAIPDEVTFTINDKSETVKVAKNLSVEPAGAFMAAREIITDEIAKYIATHGEADLQQNFSPSLSACAQILAQYFYCRATGQPYNEHAAAEFEGQVKQLPVTDALPIAKYFFLNYPNLLKPKTAFWHRLRRRLSSVPA